MKLKLIVLFSASMVSGSCQCGKPSSSDAALAAPPGATSATVPAKVAKLVRRTHVTSAREFLLSSEQKYLLHEGPAKRGRAFETLVGLLEHVRQTEPPITEFEVMALLGPPDFGQPIPNGTTTYLYLYDKKAAKDWIAFVDIDPQGFVDGIGWNATVAVDLTKAEPFEKWRELSSRP